MAPKKITPTPDNARSLWPGKEPHDYPNNNSLHRINLIDYGFNYLNIPVPETPRVSDTPALPAAPSFKDPAKQATYLQTITAKLCSAKDFILKEIELGLDSNRRMDKDATAILLAKGPIAFNFYTQEFIRDLVKIRNKIHELGGNEDENEEELQKLGHEWLWFWKELKGAVVALVPKVRVETQQKWAEEIIVGALGENLVEAPDGEKMDFDGDGEKAFV